MQKKEDERKQINTVIFDFGGIIVENPDSDMFDHMGVVTGVEKERLLPILQEVIPKIQTGVISEADACWEIEKRLKIKINISPVSFFTVNLQLKPETVEIIKELLMKEYKVAILTNTIPSHFKRIRALLMKAIPELEEKYILASCNLGVRKDGRKELSEGQKDIFRVVLKLLGVNKNQAVFLDDNPDFILQSQRAGIDSILVDPKTTKLQELLFSRLSRPYPSE